MRAFVEFLQQLWTNLQNGQLPELGFWNYFLLALLIVWQGPIATLLGGAASSTGLLRPLYVFLAGIIGNLTADIVWYTVGHRGNLERLIARRGWFGIRRDHLEKLQRGMQQHATKILLLAKLSAGLAVPALVAAGLSRLRWRRWFPVVFIGEAIWTGTLVVVGFYAAEAIKQVEHGFQIFLAATTVGGILLLMWSVPRLLRQSQALSGPSGQDEG